jgi:hypothetical protein
LRPRTHTIGLRIRINVIVILVILVILNLLFLLLLDFLVDNSRQLGGLDLISRAEGRRT